MKIRKLQLKNIGVFDDETIEFQECPAKDKAEIHILTGENGSGKTTILQALISSFKFNPDTHQKKEISYEKRNLIQAVSNVSFQGDHYKNDVFKKIETALTELLEKIPDEQIKLEKQVKQQVATELFKKLRIMTHIGRFNENASNVKVYTDEPPTNTSIYGCSSCQTVHISTQFGFTKHNTENYSKAILSSNLSGFEFEFAVFAHSGYRQIESETIQANYLPKNFNPLSQSLEFIKDYRKEGEITINQLVANNISNRALSKEDGSLEEAKKYEAVINSIETFIKDVTDYDVKFVLKRSPNELKIRMHGEELDFDVLPDGLRSLISWIADLLGRVDLLKWQDDLPITEKNLILFLDEIEVHLHPAWQRKVLPIVQKLFKNAQIFVSTHSPFVVNSVDDAWVYKLKVKDGKAKVESVTKSEDGYSYETVLREIFDIDKRFGGKTQEKLESFLKDSRSIITQNGNAQINKEKFLEDARNLATESAELQSVVFLELAKLSNKTGESYEI